MAAVGCSLEISLPTTEITKDLVITEDLATEGSVIQASPATWAEVVVEDTGTLAARGGILTLWAAV